MNIYHYDRETGELLGIGQADESPEEPGVFLIPGHATAITPPAVVDGYTRCFIDGVWTQVEDHRGKKIYLKLDGSELMVTVLGPIPNQYIDQAPTVPYPTWKNQKWVTDVDREKNYLITSKLAEIVISDEAMHRVTEDLIDTLISKGVITQADLPEAAKTKLAERKTIRSELTALTAAKP